MAAVNGNIGTNANGSGNGNGNGNATVAYHHGTPPGSHDANGSPSGTTTPGGGQGDGSSNAYMPVQNGRKRKADGTSSRGVANLTPEQLAKKRANDREAQRAIRERTKNTIENLERRIKELESQQPFQELQHVIRLKDAVLAENDDLKRRMQSILALLQPLAASQGLNGQSRQYPTANIIALADGSDLAAATARQSPLPMATAAAAAAAAAAATAATPAPPSAPAPPQAQMYHTHAPASSSSTPAPTLGQQQQQQQQHAQHTPQHQYDAAFAQHHLHPDLRNSSHASPTPQRSLPPSIDGHHGQHDMRRWSPSMGAPSAQYPTLSQHAPPTYPDSKQQPPSSYSDAAQQHSDRFALQHAVDDHMKAPFLSAADMRRRELAPITSEEPLYRRLPVNTDPTCTLDGILRGFEAERRRAAQAGTSTDNLVGPSYPSISSLLNPTRAVSSHPLSKVFTDILSKFPSISDVPEQIAVLYIMFLIMRWHIAPTQENYERLPEWARPVRSQLEIPHPSWIDHLPWPTMRDRIIRASAVSAYPFDSFFIPYTTTLSLNWPYEHSQCLLPASFYNKSPVVSSSATADGPPLSSASRQGSNDASVASNAIENALNGRDDGEEFMINPVFESHLRNLDNWSLGTPFRNAFPDLVDDVRVRDVRPPVSSTAP